MNHLDAVVFKKDNGYFAFVKKYPAAAVSADNMDDLFKRLRIALSEVVKHEKFNYTLHKLSA
jgi:predicted RNase H-like HicB family nuclease